MTSTPPTDQQLDDITAIASRAADDPFYVSDCEGSLQVWREKALVRVRRDESGEIDMYSFPSTYKVTDQIIELDLSTWDPGEDATDDQQRQDINDLVEARAALPVLLDTIRRQRTELAAFEMLAPQQCPAGKHADWLVDSEYAHACPWCQVEGLRAELVAARGQAIVWAADAVDAKLTAEPDHNRASALYELLLHLRGELPCTCARSGGLHSKGCRRYVPGHELISRHNQLAVYRAAAVAPDTASEATSAPLSPSPASSVSESAQSPTRTPEGAPRDSGAEQRDRRERYATAIHDAMEPDLSLVDQEPACQALFARAAEAAVALADTEAVEDLASADNPTHLRWGLNDVLWGDDDSVIVLLSGPDREPYWLELDPERAAVLREDLAGPDEEQQATARCGHDIETALGTYPCERDTDHDGDCDERTEAEYAAEGSGH